MFKQYEKTPEYFPDQVNGILLKRQTPYLKTHK